MIINSTEYLFSFVEMQFKQYIKKRMDSKIGVGGEREQKEDDVDGLIRRDSDLDMIVFSRISTKF